MLGPNKLLRLCNLFNKTANLEEDMAKRIMLSIIPSVMDPRERSSMMVDPEFWGIDYKVLRAASNGAKDLIKYGTGICIDELKYYGAPLKDIIAQTYSTAKKEALLSAKEETYEKFNEAQDALIEKDYIKALKISLECFKDYDIKQFDIPNSGELPVRVSLWADAYGGESWARIAKTLYEIAVRWKELQNVREAHRRGDEDSLKKEVQLMKEIVVLMNVFDGLAHNTGNVMPKLIQKEISKGGVILPGAEGGYEHEEASNAYKAQITRLMDAKELENPMEVFKEVEYLMSATPYREMFRDWIGKIIRHPEYQALPPKEERDIRIQDIRKKKKLMEEHGSAIMYSYDVLQKLYKNYLHMVEKNDFVGVRNALQIIDTKITEIILEEVNRFERIVDPASGKNDHERAALEKLEATLKKLIAKINSFSSKVATFYYAMENVRGDLRNIYLSTVKSSHVPELRNFMEEIKRLVEQTQHQLGAV